MKKQGLILLLFAIVLTMTACGSGKKAQEAYDAIGEMAFSDESILTAEESSRLQTMREDREKGLSDKNVDALTSLKNEWDEFSAPINEFIAQYDGIRATFFSSDTKAMLTEEELSQVEQYESNIVTAYENRDEAGLMEAGEEWNNYSENLRSVLQSYKSIDQDPFTDKDEVFFPDSVWAEIDSLRERTEAALSERDAATLHSLEREWDEFENDIKSRIEEKKQEIMDQWAQTLDQGSSFTNLLTMGTMTTSTSIEGHQIKIVSQYLTNNGISDDNIRASLETYLSLSSSVFQSGLDYLKTYIDDVSIRIEYRNVDGDIVGYKEFK